MAALRKNDQKAQYQNLDSVDVFDGVSPSTSGAHMVTTNPFKKGTGGANPFECYLGEDGDGGEEGAAAAATGDDGGKAQEPTKDDFEGSLVKG